MSHVLCGSNQILGSGPRPSFPIWLQSSADSFRRNCPTHSNLPGRGADAKFRPLWLNSGQIWSHLRSGAPPEVSKGFFCKCHQVQLLPLPVLLHSPSHQHCSQELSQKTAPTHLLLRLFPGLSSLRHENWHNNNVYLVKLLWAYDDALNTQCV